MSALKKVNIDENFIANKMVDLLQAKTINPITGDLMEDNVTQRNVLSMLVKNIYQLDKKDEPPKKEVQQPQIVQMFWVQVNRSNDFN